MKSNAQCVTVKLHEKNLPHFFFQVLLCVTYIHTYIEEVIIFLCYDASYVKAPNPNARHFWIFVGMREHIQN